VLVASKLDSDRQTVIRIGKKNLIKQRQVHGDGPARTLVAQWEQLITRPKTELQHVLVSPSPECIDVRHASPFAGVLSDAERQWVIRATREGPKGP
jgi:hypothetical protein